MKDDKLEKEFGEYFKGVNTPAGITEDAKRYVGQRRRTLPKFMKLASVAASLILVFAVTLTLIVKADFRKEPVGGAPDASFTLYTDDQLETGTANAYRLSSLHSSLKFIENFAVADNASVTVCNAKYKDGKLALVTAEVGWVNNLTRDDTEIFVEFTEANLVYGGLESYYDGTKQSYRGAEYYITRKTAENGEPEFRLTLTYDGVKYYFAVRSNDESAYLKYLDLILK